MSTPSSSVVFGAGRLGQRVARSLHPAAFCDNNSALWGSEIEGVSVLSPAEAAQRYPDATFVVAIWHPSLTDHIFDRIHQLHRLGATQVISFTELIDNFPELLPNFFWEKRSYFENNREQIAAARALLDTQGKEVLEQQLQLRLGNFAPFRLAEGEQYFPPELIRLGNDEVFIDCGAYNGDTISDFLRACNGQFERIFAFEPDPENCAQLQASVNGDKRIAVYPYATGMRRETLSFAADGTSSHVGEDGTISVQCVPLDEILSEVRPTYIKMDIEGSEVDALEGSRQVIAHSQPKLAVCVYHKPDHLWRIPLMLHELQPNARLTLRSYRSDGFDCVCYSIPATCSPA